MIGNMTGGILGLELLLQSEVLFWFLREQEPTADTEQVIRGVSWLSEEAAEPSGVPPEFGEWTCPRCGSHRRIRTNLGDSREAAYCCSVCGYAFGGSSAQSS